MLDNFTSAVRPGYQTSLSVKVGEGLVRKDLSMRGKRGLLALTIVASIAFPPLGIGMLISTALGRGNLYTYLVNRNKNEQIRDQAKLTLNVNEGVEIIKKLTEAYKLLKRQINEEFMNCEGTYSEKQIITLIRLGADTRYIERHLGFIKEDMAEGKLKHNQPLIDVAETVLELREVYKKYISLHASINKQNLQVESNLQLKSALLELGLELNWTRQAIIYNHLKNGVG
jgi:hypothetical protein